VIDIVIVDILADRSSGVPFSERRFDIPIVLGRDRLGVLEKPFPFALAYS